jgi:hypothetical protein
MRPFNEPSNTWKTRLIALWCAVIMLGYAVTTVIMAEVLHHEKLDAIERHDARLSTDKVEEGRTAAETRQFDIGRQPKNITVTSGIYVDRIFDVSLRDTSWKVDFYIWFEWLGENVHPGENFQIINGEILDLQLKTKTSVPGPVVQNYELYRVTAEITKFFNISRYPRDDHLMTILVEDTKRQFYDLRFKPDVTGSDISSRVKIPGYEIFSSSLIEKPHSYRTRRGDPRLPEDYKSTYSQLVLGIDVKRGGWGLYLKMFVGIFAAVGFSMLAFFVNPAHTSPRFGIGVGAFFASIASIYVISSQIPLSSEYTLTDYVTVSSVITIFLTLLTSTRSVHIHEAWTDGPLWAWRLDRIAQVLFLLCYSIQNAVLAASASL